MLLWQCAGVCGGCTWLHGNNLEVMPRKSQRWGFETKRGGSQATSQIADSGVNTGEREREKEREKIQSNPIHYVVSNC